VAGKGKSRRGLRRRSEQLHGEGGEEWLGRGGG
jgi:hypothetical protein